MVSLSVKAAVTALFFSLLASAQTTTPPDGIVPIGIDPAQAALIGNVKNAPTAVDRVNTVLNAGKTYIFDFLASPLTGGVGVDGFFTLAYDGNFPAAVGNSMAAAFFVLGPCGMIAPHTHPRAAEFLYLITGGPMRFGINFEAGGPIDYEFLQPGMAVMLPQGSMHYGGVLGCDPSVVIAMFNSEDPGFELSNFALFGFDTETLQASLGQIGAQPLDASHFPAPLNVGFESCRQTCGIPDDYDISTVSKLQVMEAAFTAFATRTAAGSLNTTADSRYSAGPSAFPASIPLPPVVPGASTIRYGNETQATTKIINGNANFTAAGATSGSSTTSLGNSTAANSTKSLRVGGFASTSDGDISASKFKSYRIATYALAGTTGLFLLTTLALGVTVLSSKKAAANMARPGGRSSMPLFSSEQRYDKVDS